MLGNIFKSKFNYLKSCNIFSASKRCFSTKVGARSQEKANIDPEINSKTPSKQFEKQINSVNKMDEEDYSSIEQYMKIFNDKVYKQNVELTNKLADLFKEDKTPSGAKIFTVVNEINKINLNNSSKLLQVFLNQILKYNDSVRLFIQQSEKKSNKFSSLIPLTMFMVWVCGLLYIYSYYKNQGLNYNKLFENLIKQYNDNAQENFKINIKYPILDDHRSVTNLINFELYKHIVIIGPSSLGKTESIKHFCLSQCLKDVLTVYIDLNTLPQSENFSLQDTVMDILVKNYKGKEINNHNINMIHNRSTSDQLFNYIKNSQVCFVFDNYHHERDSKRVLDVSIPNVKQNPNWRSLIVSNTNELVQSALEKQLEVKHLNFLQTRTFKNYLVEKLNNYVKKRVEFSNLELFTDENINYFFKTMYYLSFEDLFNYLENNSSIESK